MNNKTANTGGGFGSFGSTSAFGATPSSAFGSSGNSFGIQTTSSLQPSGFNFGSIAQQPPTNNPTGSAVSSFPSLLGGPSATATGAVQQQFSFDTPYKGLPQNVKEVIDNIYREFKAPTRRHLEDLENRRGQAWEQLAAELAKVRIRTLSLATKQQLLQESLKPALEQVKQLAKEARSCRAQGGGLQQIRAASGAVGGPHSIHDEALPSAFYVHAEQSLEQRLQQTLEALRHLQRLEHARLKARTASDGQTGLYGQPQKVGAKQLLELLQRQNEAFMRVAAFAAEAHNETAALKEQFLARRRAQGLAGDGSSDPFAAADRKEWAEQRLQQQKMKGESMKFQLARQQQKQQQPAPQNSLGLSISISTSAIPTSSGAFSIPNTSTSTALTPSSGFGFGLGSSSQQALPAFGSALGATPAAGTASAATGTTSGFGGFGSPATSASTTGFSSFGLLQQPQQQQQQQQQQFGSGLFSSLDLAQTPATSSSGKKKYGSRRN